MFVALDFKLYTKINMKDAKSITLKNFIISRTDTKVFEISKKYQVLFK